MLISSTIVNILHAVSLPEIQPLVILRYSIFRAEAKYSIVPFEDLSQPSRRELSEKAFDYLQISMALADL